MNKLFYLAGPLDGLNYDGTAWYEEFDTIRPDGLMGFAPGRAYIGAADNPDPLNRANRAVIRASDGLFANLTGQGRALGTIREIEFAKSLGKAVIVIGDLKDSLASYDLKMVPDLQSAIEVAKEFAS